MNEYWVVLERSTNKVIAHCGEERDAIMMLLLDSKNGRVCKKQRFINDQVINITFSGIKELPGQLGLPADCTNRLQPHNIALPKGEQEPIKI